MRVEDLDGPRNKPDAAQQALDTLTWLGLDYDGGILLQSTDLEPYRAAMRDLAAQRLAYSCDLTRSEIEAAASAPHAPPGTGPGSEVRYPAHLRPSDTSRFTFEREDTNYRFVVHNEPVIIEDHVAGVCEQNPHDDIGDFVIWTRRGQPAYQLAVVVDDARQGVTDVVRGNDLLSSASRQSLLYRALGLREPRWWHLPLVLGEDGRRLAKRHGDTRIDTYRAAGISRQRIIGLLAAWSGVQDDLREMSAENFREGFDLTRLSRDPVVFTEEHHRWLLGT